MKNKKKNNIAYIHQSADLNFCSPNLQKFNNNKIPKKIIALSNVIIYTGCKLGENIFFGHNAIVRQQSKIGSFSKIGSNTELGSSVIVGEKTTIHSNCFICENTKIGKNCFIGPNVNFLNSKFPYRKDSKKKLNSAKISNNVIIGSGSIIMPGVKIGNNVIIGAGTMVSKNIKSNSKVYLKNNLMMFSNFND